MSKDKNPIKVIANGNSTWGKWRNLNWQSLTDEEIENIANKIMFRLGSYDVDMIEIGRAIEQALKEKNGC